MIDPMYDHWLEAPYQRTPDGGDDPDVEAYWESLMESEEVAA